MIVLVVSSRGDSVNRLPSVLEWIESTLGAHTLASVVVAVVEVRPGSTPVAITSVPIWRAGSERCA